MTTLKETYLYCTACKATLKQSGDTKICPQCEKRYYFNALPNVTTVITNEHDELLLFRRTQEPFKGLWDMPGGFMQKDESMEAAAIREAYEETGVTISDLRYSTSLPTLYDYQGITYDLVLVLFEAKLNGNSQLKTGNEASDCRFFAKKDVPLEQVAFKAQRDFLKTYLA